MAGKKSAKTMLRESVALSVRAQQFYGYADYFNRVPLFTALQVTNSGSETIEDLDVQIDCAEGFLLPFNKHLESVPFESAVEISAANIVSPLYLTELSELAQIRIQVAVLHGKDVLAEESVELTVLPFDYWSGRAGNAELLSCFVRPKVAECLRVLNEAVPQLQKWGVSCEWRGYQEGDKNKIRQIAAAIFAVVKRQSIEKSAAEYNYNSPVPVGDITVILKNKVCTSFELSLFLASCFECAGLHPVLTIGEKSVSCGVWLYDNCFSDSVSDDTVLLQKYLSDGINNVSMFDVEDVFAGKNVNYTAAEKHYMQKLESNYFDTVVDVKRCRLARIASLPLKVRGIKGYELLGESETDINAAPESLSGARKLSYDGKVTRNKQWERRLLDLSLKNTLLNFRPEKNTLHILSADINETYESLAGGEEFFLMEKTADVRGVMTAADYFPASGSLSMLAELLSVELKNHRLRTYSEREAVADVLRFLIKKAKTAEEEAGANVLFLAFGFLKWYESQGSEPRYAPLVLCPVRITRSKGGKGYSVAFAEENMQINSTLLEFLLREFKIDIRGLDNIASGIRVSEIMAMVRMEILNMKGWEVLDEVYLANFSFARFAMWNDVRKNIDKFRKNALVKSLLDNRMELADNVFEDKAEDDYAPSEVLTPLMADCSQFEAIAEAAAGATFVLHGPPGTGKSQTITNIIANCLNQGKRVLFVAEKQAALSVVKKRLDSIGLGDFCLELHSAKLDKAALLRGLENTLALAAEQDDPDFESKNEQIGEVRKTLNEPIMALHKKRRLGVSVYEGILIYLKNKNAPDVLDIESTFYDSLTKERLDTYENLLIEVSAAAKQCGGVHRSPFENVNLTEYDPDLRNQVYYSSEVLIAEIKHVKNYLSLFLDFYRQRVSAFTEKKMQTLLQLIDLLRSGVLDKYFHCDENEFYVFFNANRRLDRLLGNYFKNFKTLIDIDCDPAVIEQELDNWGENYKSSKVLSTLVKRLRKSAAVKLAPSEETKYIGIVAQIYEDLKLVRDNTSLVQNFSDRGGKISFKRRDEFMEALKQMHALAEGVFMDYNADSFNSVCVKSASGGYAAPILDGLKQSLQSFRTAKDNFCDVIRADTEHYSDEDVLDYFNVKAGALIDNIDMLAAWCLFKKISAQLDSEGLSFVTDSLESGAVTSENILESFRKNVYRNFVETNIGADPVLSKFSAAVLEEKIEQFRVLDEQFAKLSKAHIRNKLISNLPTTSTEGGLSLEVLAFQRIVKSNMRGMTVKEFIAEIPELFARLAPCVLMSPITVAQYLKAEPDLFDLVVFDEASQLPTSEAIGALARAKNAVVVGDPKQLPPTSFFSSGYVDEENLDTEDLESILDDCLALSMPEKHLNWHYRSKHESLIAFSNIMYYGGKLCTFPSPDALESKVRLALVPDGIYDRGFTKRNKAEAEALVEEVVRRLKDPKLSRSSIGVVTFSTAQQDYIERRLSDALVRNKLEDAAYEREEPLFIKNLENVQGDERDVILFSVCYGPDRSGRVALNFGPLNQTGGWRRLNVAVSRAREEMVVFSSMTSAMINLAKTNSKGVAGLKAFLEFAEKGKTSLAISSDELKSAQSGIGKYVAQELKTYGYECRYDVGVSDFKIDCAVVDPKNKKRFILAIICDGTTAFHSSAKDRNILQIQTLKMNNWNVVRLFTINFINNPKREIKKIKEILDRLTGTEKIGRDYLSKYKKNYRFAKLEQTQNMSQYVTCGENDGEILARLKAISAAEEPISDKFLMKRCLSSLGIQKYGQKVEERITNLIKSCGLKGEVLCGKTYLRKTDKCLDYDFYRVEQGDPIRKSEDDFTPYEIIALIKGLLENKVSLYADELTALVCAELKITRPSDKLTEFIGECVNLGVERSVFVRSISDRISLY